MSPWETLAFYGFVILGAVLGHLFIAWWYRR